MPAADVTPAGTDRLIERLVGVYDADGTVRGELAYWVGARLGRAHCSLCDITHTSVREKSAWRSCRAGLPVPFDTHHRDDVPAGIAAAVDRSPPYVAAVTAAGAVLLLDGDALDRCAGSVDAMVDAVEVAIEAAGLAWPR